MYIYKVKVKVAESCPTLLLLYKFFQQTLWWWRRGTKFRVWWQRGLQAGETKKEQWAPGADIA